MRAPSDGLLGGVIAILLGLLALIPQLGGGLASLSYDLAYLFRPQVRVEEPVIIYMDLDSHVRLGQQQMAPWDRALHARLIDHLKKSQARTVVFDVRFDPWTNTPAADAELVRAVKAHGKVVVAATVTPVRLHGELRGWRLNPPFPALEGTAAWGLAEVATTADASVRKHYGRKDFAAPSIAWRAAELSLTNLPADPYQPRWVNYYGPAGTLPHYSYWEVLAATNPLPAGTFSNKVVFVGSHYDVAMTGGKETDDFRTPYTRWKGTRTAGVEVNATTYLNLARSDWLTRTTPLMELLLLVISGGAAGLGLARCRPTIGAGLGLLCAVLTGLIAMLLVWEIRVWFPWLIVSGLQIPAAIAWSCLAHTRRLAWRNRALENSMALAEAPAGVPPAALQPPARKLTTTINLPSPPEAPKEPERTPVPTVPDHTLVRRIGEGAYGEVWLARDIIGTYHAVKVVFRKNFREAGPFEREFNGIKRFTPISASHPGLVHVLHVGRHERNDYIYYVMELADDETSGRKIDEQTYSPKSLGKELKRREGMSMAETLSICIQLADALGYLHDQQLIHRDIKPANLIFVKGRVKLADIGLVTEVASDDRSVSFLGTQGYIPPEGPGTPQADIYSLGKVIYEATTGFPLNRFPEFPTELMEMADGGALMELNGIVLTACDTDPRKRFRSATELKAALLKVEETLKR